ncbi:MAG TPA: DNA replication/repair protein RecF [Hypericibacter adhaerens]|jgi:DNA replication and repair protein RecF|uniref:DNA replication/repair protein RecF n=1 Tax=Hypericibacter adhaerens TaxID=2602016 RepID=UPI002C2BDF06|nr:DNA replication/repair protein RecF [Hypericibacter adhaerens]HWA44501.1 DNA replication/repair protein RecF [Hypericibacter adhaerens]
MTLTALAKTDPTVIARPLAARPAAAHLTRLALADFRCYREAVLETDARPVVLAGPNGAGKTNLLEAISFLAPGRGLRRARLTEIERRPVTPTPDLPGAWAVAARLVNGPGPEIEIGTGRDPAAGEGTVERRVVKIDGAFRKGQSALAERLALVWLTPQMDRLFLDGAGDRRRFLDRLVYGFDPAHATRVSAYEQALRERARLLTAGQWSGQGAWLDGLEAQMAELGVAVAAARRDLLLRLKAAAADGFGPFPGAAIALQGLVDEALAAMPALAAEDALKARLAETRALDAQTGGAAVGPHKSDLAVTHLGRGRPAAECSTGEQKALLLAIVLAYARALAEARGSAPLILLDEVAAHLDRARRRALFEAILETGAQAWLTGTDIELFAELGEAARFVAVEEGRLRPRPGAP